MSWLIGTIAQNSAASVAGERAPEARTSAYTEQDAARPRTPRCRARAPPAARVGQQQEGRRRATARPAPRGTARRAARTGCRSAASPGGGSRPRRAGTSPSRCRGRATRRSPAPRARRRRRAPARARRQRARRHGRFRPMRGSPLRESANPATIVPSRTSRTLRPVNGMPVAASEVSATAVAAMPSAGTAAHVTKALCRELAGRRGTSASPGATTRTSAASSGKLPPAKATAASVAQMITAASAKGRPCRISGCIVFWLNAAAVDLAPERRSVCPAGGDRTEPGRGHLTI